RAGAHTDLTLTGGGHLVVVHLDLQTHGRERLTHVAPQILQRVHRGDREVATLDAGTVPQVAALDVVARRPGSLGAVDLVERAVHVRAVLDVVEDEELVLGAEEGVVGNARGPQVLDSALGAGARTTLITLAVRGLDHGAANDRKD